jgi:carbamoyl-phosphate synthase small subunit
MKTNLPDIYQPSFEHPTALLILEDNTILKGHGFGAETIRVGEVCFNTSMTGYQEIMTDPSYAGQIITFTFPHIGNTGTNNIDIETETPAALGMIVTHLPTPPSNYRSHQSLDEWLTSISMPGIAGIDTRALTQRIRDQGAPKGVLAVNYKGEFDIPALQAMLQAWPGLAGMELAASVTSANTHNWTEGGWDMVADSYNKTTDHGPHIVSFDFGCKLNILRCLGDASGKVTVVPADTSAEAIFKMKPDGVFLSNGPGDPAATADYAAPVIRQIAEAGIPIFGICIGHQLIAEAFGAKTFKMERGHRGANHPVKELVTGMIEITSQNHGFAVDPDSLPDHLSVTHISLFDGSVEGLRHTELPVFCVQYHPEASPGPHDAHHLFTRFAEMIGKAKSSRSDHAKA